MLSKLSSINEPSPFEHLFHIHEYVKLFFDQFFRHKAVHVPRSLDEIRHARDAQNAGGVELPTPMQWAMRAIRSSRRCLAMKQQRAAQVIAMLLQ
jgi:hypothetical protein